MTSPTERDLATFVAATKAADEQDAQMLLAIVRKLREDDDLRYEHSATALEAMAKRMTERLRAAARWDESGMLDETDVGIPLASLAESSCAAGTDAEPSAPPSSASAPSRRGRPPK